MSSPTSGKVIPLNSHGRERDPGQRILSEARNQLREGLTLWLREVATPIADELFHLADSTRERLMQTRYLDLRADIDKDWAQLVDAFRHALLAEADRCQFVGIDGPGSNPATALEIPDFEGLQLIADEALSEHIVIREFSAQLSETCDAELYALDRRVAALLGQDEPVAGRNPLAPPVICQSLTDACAALGADAEDRLLLLRRLERHLHIALPAIYQGINANLIERGILPDLKRSYRRSSPATGTTTAAPDSPPPQTSANGNAPLPADSFLSVMQRLAFARGQSAVAGGGAVNFPAASPGHDVGAPTGAAPPAAMDAPALTQLFLASLNQIQHNAPAGSEDLPINQVRLVRDSEAAQKIGHVEAVTLDIVAMLFDFIFDDAIPSAIKALVSRLQIPVLKVAMLDHTFFADRAHPARRFLGGISGIAVRWGNAVDESDPFYCKLAELVERIQGGFENDVRIFGTALSELEAFVDERENEEEKTVLAAAGIVVRREQESSAWERAQQAVQTFRARRLPALIDSFLVEHWIAALQQVAREHSAESADWQSATGTMEDLAWSIEAKKTQEDRLKLIVLLPRLLTQLNKGLDSINAAPEQRRAFFDALVEYHSAALKGDARGTPATLADTPPAAASTARTDPPQNDGDLVVMRSVDNGVEVEEVILVGASPSWRSEDRDAFRLVAELKRGDWLEFRQEDGSTSRERLNWISPQRGILVFSNHRSARAISVSPEALARQLRDGQARIVRDDALFERALSGVLESLNAA